MRVVIINSVYGFGSTGRICASIANQLKKDGHIVKCVYGRKVKSDGIDLISMKDNLSFISHVLETRLFDNHAFASRIATLRMLQKLDEFNPDLLWLHNIHGYYINVEMLFKWIKSKPNLKVKWTLHDCWSFTGHCSHFLNSGCNQWKTGCVKCGYKKTYPKCIGLSFSHRNYERKKKAFCGVHNLELITPSQWLADLTRYSFLSEYPVSVVYNTIDTSIFHKTDSSFKKMHGIESFRIILGVSNVWSKRKGFEDFLCLSKELPEEWRIVLVGVSEKQLKELPDNCIGIKRTSSQTELVDIYNSADIFFNPTYEDNYPTVNLEAKACGIFIISYDTGGCRETFNENEGTLIPVGKWNYVLDYIAKGK